MNNTFLRKLLLASQIALYALSGLTIIVTILGVGSELRWEFELLSHPKPQYVIVLFTAVVISLTSHRKLTLLWLIPLLVNLWPLLPLYYPDDAVVSPPIVSITHLNLDNTQPTHSTAFEVLRRRMDTIIFIQELTPELAERVPDELPDYEIILSHPLTNTHGSAMLLNKASDITVTSAQIIHLPDYSTRPLIEATIELKKRKIRLLSLHVIRQKSQFTSEFQQIEFEAVARWSHLHQTREGYEIVVIGDFNSTPWSNRFKRLLAQGKLKNSQPGYGLQPTWPAMLPPFAMIPIDHCIHSDGIQIASRSIGSQSGGDHLPLHISFGLK
jgi:endonuclease/exonuclease/phosphatase (EEP) superfamily protein YafD